MPRLFRSCAVAAALLLLALVPAATPAQRPADPGVQRIEIRAQAIEAFDPREPARVNFGVLAFRGGLVLEVPR